MRLWWRARCGFTAIATRAGWRSSWNERAVPLSKIQSELLRIIARQRDAESYVAGATPLNRTAARVSSDVDLFHDLEERVRLAAERDAEILKAAGYHVVWLRRLPSICTAEVSKDGEGTRLEWVVDSDYRFFPVIEDELFGFVLHPIDLAINKVMEAAGRREVRDIVDLVTIDRTILSLGALVWAAVEKSPAFTPEGLIAEIRRNLHYPRAEWESIAATDPVDAMEITAYLRAALDRAEAFLARMPTDKIGLLFLKGSEVVEPDPGALDDYQTHAGDRSGHWPSDPEIQRAMLERYTQRKEGQA